MSSSLSLIIKASQSLLHATMLTGSKNIEWFLNLVAMLNNLNIKLKLFNSQLNTELRWELSELMISMLDIDQTQEKDNGCQLKSLDLILKAEADW
jgi:hypothetical protein